jgi:chaperone modulatory protein CbpM
MMSFDVLVRDVDGLEDADLARWIANSWVKPDLADGRYVFEDIDIARVHLIYELRQELDVNEAALPVVLLLLDQLYDVRRHLQELGVAIADTEPADLHRALQVIAARRSWR